MSDLNLRVVIRAVVDQFTAALRGARDQLNQLGQTDLNRLQQAVNRTEQGVFGLGRSLDGVKGVIASAFAVTGIISFTRQLTEAVQKAQDLRLRLSGLTQGQGDYAASEAYLVDLADRHHKSLSMLTESYSAFLALEQSGIINRQQSMQLLEGFSNAGSKVGATATQIGQSVYGLAQALGTGIVAMEEFKQITDPMPGLANEIAKAYGKSVGELRQLIGTGTITSDDFGKKFVIALKAYEGAAERAAGTISASYADIENAYIAMAKELEKPVASGVLGLVDSGKAAYGWIKDNGDAVVASLSLIAATLAGKVVGSLASYATAKSSVIAVERAHRAALIEQAERNLAVIAGNLALSESNLALVQSDLAAESATLALTNTTIARTEAQIAALQSTVQSTSITYLLRQATAELTAAETQRSAVLTRLAALGRTQATLASQITTATTGQTVATEALTAANNSAGVAMTRLTAAGKAAFAFIGGWVGSAVIALYGLYSVLEQVTGAEEKAELKAKSMADALALSALEVKKLSALEVDIDFKKTEKSIDNLKTKLKELESFSLDKLLSLPHLNRLATERDNILQELAVLEARKPELVTQKREQIKNFEPSGLSSDELNAELKKTQDTINGINAALSHTQDFNAKTELNLDLNAYQSKLAAIKGMIDEGSRTGQPNSKLAEANASAEQKIIESTFKLKEQLAKNAYDTAIALAGDDQAKRLQIDKDYNAETLKLTLARLDAQAAALEAVNAVSTKKTKDPELKAQLAAIEDQRTLAQSDAETRRIQLSVDTQKTAADDVLSVQLANIKTQQDALKAANEYDLKQVTNTYAAKGIALKQQYDSELITKQQLDSQLLDLERAKAAEELAIKRKLAAQTTQLELDAIDAKIQSEQAGGSGNYDGLINAATQQHGLPEGLVRAVIQRESSGNPTAVSSAGAQGLMGLMPGTAKGLGVTDSFDPAQNIEAGARYLKQMLTAFKGDMNAALMAYNAGENSVKRVNGDYGKLTTETQQYPSLVLGEMQNPTSGGPAIDNVKLKALYAEREAVIADGDAQLKALDLDAQANALEQSTAELAIQKAAQEQQAQLDAESATASHDAALAAIDEKQAASEQELALGNITQEQHLANLREFAAQRLGIEIDLLDAKRKLMTDDALALAQNLHEKEALVRGYVATQKGLDNKEAADKQAAFKTMFQPFETAMDGMVQGVLTGQQTIGNAVKHATASIVTSYAATFIKTRVMSAAQWAWEVSGFAGKEAKKQAIEHAGAIWEGLQWAGKKARLAAEWAWDLLGFGTKEAAKTETKIVAEGAQTGAQVLGDTLRAESSVASAETSKAATADTAKSSIMDKALDAAAGAYDAMVGIPYVGPIIAPIAASVAFVGVSAFGAMVGSAKGGEWEVGQDGSPYILHEKESVLPAGVADNFRKVVSIVNNHVQPKDDPLAVVNQLFSSGKIPRQLTLPASAINLAGQSQAAANAFARDRINADNNRQTETPTTHGDTHINIHGIAMAPEAFFEKHSKTIVKVAHKEARNFNTGKRS